MAIQTTSFKIARYLLLALVLIVCIWMILWTMYSQAKREERQNTPTVNVVHVTQAPNSEEIQITKE
ncbi:MAG TPA: hypothetical protein IAC63_00630 [Candidatus Enterousia avicola]|uniref:Uncharacterized protein n=1 Tax=Candidatus Enterousia avicola TaxID=2840787 RepID=A0A9D1MRU6_9PROT|nr:hypothetical protein [Candidatus Enterousia avicola]